MATEAAITLLSLCTILHLLPVVRHFFAAIQAYNIGSRYQGRRIAVTFF